MIIQIKRGTSAEAAVHLGLEGTLFVDLDAKLLYLHDGVKAGGFAVAGLTAAQVNQLTDASLASFEIESSKVIGLTDALNGMVKTADIGASIASLVDGNVPMDQMPIDELAALLGFTQVGGVWVLAKDRVAV